jgi:ubiquinone/menaquinone biosynthesis C-methylase UbiE
MNLTSAEDWHQRYTQQARWTQDLRRYLYQQIPLKPGQRLLDVGCGTGALTPELLERGVHAYGLDIDQAGLVLARNNHRGANDCQADAFHLPFPPAAFDVAICHFLLLWLADPLAALREMKRVIRPNGIVLAIAEPDYGGRIDHPEVLARLGAYQVESLRLQGADPTMGRKLSGFFHQAGLKAVETGVLGGQWTGQPDWRAWELEWQVLENDIRRLGENLSDIESLKAADRVAYQSGGRVLFVPTFYALGRVPSIKESP